MTDLLLVFPPSVLAETLPVSLAALTAYVRREGYCVEQDDWSARFNSYCAARTELKVVSGVDDILHGDRLFIKNFFLHYIAGSYFSELDIGEWTRNPSRGDAENSTWSPPYPFSYMQFLQALLDDPNKVDDFVEDRERNIFHAFFESEILPGLSAPRVVGFSVVSYAQAIPALTLAALVRRHLPNTHICWGGPWVTSFGQIFSGALAKHERLNRLIDSFVVSEGEEPLLQLVRAVCDGDEVGGIPNTWTRSPSGRGWVAPAGEWMADMPKLPAPDYSGFDVHHYTSYQEGRGSVVIQGSRSCYYMKCTFCNAITNLAPKYRERPVAMIREDIAHVLKQLPTARSVDFADAVFPARRLRDIAEFIISLNRDDLKWEIDVRFEKNISKELLALMKRSNGVLRFGLEHASERLLDLVKKGNRREVVDRILSDCRDIEYKPFLMTIVGLPSETIKDVHTLVDFLQQVSDTATFQVSDFMVEHGSPIHRAPREFGIDIKLEDADKLSHHIPFQRLTGYDDNLAQHAFPAALTEVLQRVNGAGNATVDRDSEATKLIEVSFACGDIKIPAVRFWYNGQGFGGVVAIGYMMQQAVTPMIGNGVLLEDGRTFTDWSTSRKQFGFGGSDFVSSQGSEFARIQTAEVA